MCAEAQNVIQRENNFNYFFCSAFDGLSLLVVEDLFEIAKLRRCYRDGKYPIFDRRSFEQLCHRI
jgi:hypothetical protein